MIATAFDEDNTVLNPPPNMTLDECDPLSVFRGVNEFGFPVVISCWKMESLREREEFLRTGRIWLIVNGLTMPPVALVGEKPFKEM